jgi:hypothetical protein
MTQQHANAQLETYNTQASLLYEQAFFTELMAKIIASRRYDEFHADVALAYAKIMEQVISSIERNIIPFDDDVPPHEVYTISNAYYTFMYLINQHTFNKLCTEFPKIHNMPELKFLARILAMLFVYIEQHKVSLQRAVAYITSQVNNILQLIRCYQRECTALRTAYTQYIRAIREQSGFDRGTYKYALHKYLAQHRKFLPLMLDSGREPILYAAATTATVVPVVTEQLVTDAQPAKRKRHEIEQPYIPVMQFIPPIPPALRNYHDILAAYDYKEYIASRITHGIEQPNEMPVLLEDVWASYQRNHDVLQCIYTRVAQEPQSCLTDSLVTLQKICAILDHMRQEPTATQRSWEAFKGILEEYYRERTPSTL